MNPEKLDKASDAKKPIAAEAKNPDPLSVELVLSSEPDRRSLMQARRRKAEAEFPDEKRVSKRRTSQRRKSKRFFASQPIREASTPIDNSDPQES